MKSNHNVRVCMVEGEHTEDIEIMQSHIKKIAETSTKMLNAGLKKETIVLLIHDYTKISRGQIKEVLDCLPKLGQIYLKENK